MMIKKIFVSFLMLLFSSSNLLSNSDLFISTILDEVISTTIDIQKEKSYLVILNPNLSSLGEDKTFQVAKNSLINEIIKKKELEKFFDLEKDIPFLKQVKTDLYSKLNIQNDNEFKKLLKDKKTYSLEEINNKLKIEILWNEFIFTKYKDLIKIDEDQLKKIENEINENLIEYSLSEILLKKDKNKDINDKIKKIKLSISEGDLIIPLIFTVLVKAQIMEARLVGY